MACFPQIYIVEFLHSPLRLTSSYTVGIFFFFCVSLPRTLNHFQFPQLLALLQSRHFFYSSQLLCYCLPLWSTPISSLLYLYSNFKCRPTYHFEIKTGTVDDWWSLNWIYSICNAILMGCCQYCSNDKRTIRIHQYNSLDSLIFHLVCNFIWMNWNFSQWSDVRFTFYEIPNSHLYIVKNVISYTHTLFYCTRNINELCPI